MKTFPHKPLPKRNQESGFTTLELIVVLVIIGVLVVAFGYNTIGRTDDAKANTAKIALSSDMPQGIFSYYSIAGVPNDGTTLTSDIAARGVKPTTPWGDTWSATSRGNGSGATVEVSYPIGAEDADNLADNIAAELSKGSLYPQISSATASNGTLTVTYKTL